MCITPSGQQHLPRPQDNFGGPLSAERLKAFSSSDNTNDSWNEVFASEPTSKCSSHSPQGVDESQSYLAQTCPELIIRIALMLHDPLQTIRPRNSMGQHSSDFEPLLESPMSSPPQPPPKNSTQPKSLIPQKQKNNFIFPSRPGLRYQEETIEDYSDLVANDAVFAQKVDTMKVGHNQKHRASRDVDNQKSKKDVALSPRLFHPPDLEALPRSAASSAAGSLRRNKHQRPALVKDDPNAMRRSRSTVEIHKYSEAEGEEDYSDVFGRDAVSETYDSDPSADDELKLQTRLSSSSWVRHRYRRHPNCRVYFFAD